jgi:hypothetical protein
MNGLFSKSYTGYIILPIDELHIFSRWLKPPTRDHELGNHNWEDET